MASMTVESIHTEVFSRGQNLHAFLRTHLQGKVQDGDVIAITSKIVSIAEDRVVANEKLSKHDLVRREADHYLGEGGFGVELTIKHGLLIPSAGIDESNSEDGGFILYPEDPYRSAARIGECLRTEFKLARVAVILTDSHTMPLRRGVTGISLAHWGLKATQSLVGAPDIFGRELKFTSVDIVDSLAATAVFMMGEADDRCPLAIIRGAKIAFTVHGSPEDISIPLEQDLYYPILRGHLR